MFFFLSKIFETFLHPFFWMLVLLSWRVFSKKSLLKKRLEIITLIVLVLFSNEIIFNSLATAWQPGPAHLSDSTTYSAGIVLGGYESYDKFDNGYFNAAADRFIQAVKLYKQKRIQKIVVSGAKVVNGKARPADFLRRQFISMGVAATDIIVEGQSKNTFENAVFSKRLLSAAGLKPPYILITSALHMPRAQQVFTKAQIAVIPYPCDFRNLPKQFDLTDYIIPKEGVIEQWPYLLKEVIGKMVYTVFKKA